MDKISNVRITDCKESLYVKPCRMLYKQDGKEKIWDLMKIHDSVAIVIFNISRKVLVFVKQFRPAIYYSCLKAEDMKDEIDTEKYPPSLGMAIELCSGIVDKCQSLEETACDEVLEECGYKVPVSSFEKVNSYRCDVGVTGSLQTLYYVEVTDDMKVSEGGGCEFEGEYIEVVELELDKAHALIFDETEIRAGSLVLALSWFFSNKSCKKYNL